MLLQLFKISSTFYRKATTPDQLRRRRFTIRFCSLRAAGLCVKDFHGLQDMRTFGAVHAAFTYLRWNYSAGGVAQAAFGAYRLYRAAVVLFDFFEAEVL
jgi:hypothetical protein